jgi:hypothetical protein
MEQPQQDGSDSCEFDIDDSYVESSDNIESANDGKLNTVEESTQVINECVNDMDVEY